MDVDFGAVLESRARREASLLRLNPSGPLPRGCVRVSLADGEAAVAEGDTAVARHRVRRFLSMLGEAWGTTPRLSGGFSFDWSPGDGNQAPGTAQQSKLPGSAVSLVPTGPSAALHTTQRIEDSLAFRDKIPGVCFAGSSSGLGGEETERILLAQWGVNNPAVGPIKITLDTTRERLPLELMGPRMSQEEQLAYAAVLSVDGNSASWQRPLWVLASNSVLVMFRPKWSLHWHDLLVSGWNCVILDDAAQIPSLVDDMRLDPGFFESMVGNAHATIEFLATESEGKRYLRAWLDAIERRLSLGTPARSLALEAEQPRASLRCPDQVASLLGDLSGRYSGGEPMTLRDSELLAEAALTLRPGSIALAANLRAVRTARRVSP
jgi:hypothetical protein